MTLLINNPNSFCLNSQFLAGCIDILCGSDGIFDVSCQSELNGTYIAMRQNINVDSYTICPLAGTHINQSNVRLGSLCKNGKVYAGHDLPVWLNDPMEAKRRIMVLSQDPRRNDKEMQNGTLEIGLSTPFGLHSKIWRSHRQRGMVHWLAKDLIEKYGQEVSIYYTDIYKFRGVDCGEKKTLHLDTNNKKRYMEVLCKEIDLFRPTIILLMGKEAQNTFQGIGGTLPPNCTRIDTPHPNARKQQRSVKAYWGNWEMNDFTVDSKINRIREEIGL